MKATVLLGILALISIKGFAQVKNTISSESYASEDFKGVNIEMPGYREINSGAKFLVTYEGDWPEEMRGAFEYAIKLWEEVLPLTAPIKISAGIGDIRGSSNALSKTTFDTFEYNGPRVNDYASPLSMIKSVLLQEYHRNERHRFYDEISDLSVLDGTDITITYNEKRINEFSFSLDGEPSANKYDFVTSVLRDIATGLGFTTSFTANKTSGTFIKTDAKPTPFENLALRALHSSDPNVMFTNATKGTLVLEFLDDDGSLTLYAPHEWENGVSLRYFIPEDNCPISKLLTYDFGKGYIMRDLSGFKWTELFRNALDWRADIATGASGGDFSQEGSTDDIIPYKGNITISFNSTNNVTKSESTDIMNDNDTANIKRSTTNSEESLTDTYCKKYNLYSPDGNPFPQGLSLSVLKKDGSWDCIYTTINANQPININIESLPLHFDETEYARGTTGGLRYRLTKCVRYFDSLYGRENYSYTTKYFTRDFTPQQASIKYSKVHQVNQKNRRGISADDEYFVDVEIGISNLEGTKKVIVEQLDEGERLPFQYEVEDFRKGYFIANLDRDLSTQLTVISYNDNGFKRSNTITIMPVGNPTVKIDFNRYADFITVQGLSESQLESGRLSYSIQCLATTIPTVKNKRLNGNTIDICNIPDGVYVLTLFDKNNKIGNYKFAK